MDEKVLTALIGGGAGLLTGTIGSLIAPWIHWGIEKRKQRYTERRRLVLRTRDQVRRFRTLYDGSMPILTSLNYDKDFCTLRLRLKKNVVAALDTNDGPTAMRIFENELARLEKQWRLV